MQTTIIFFYVINLIQSRLELQEYNQCDNTQELCVGNRTNFIIDYINGIPLDARISKVNSVVNMYSRKRISILKRDKLELGIFLNETIEKNEIIFNYDRKKVVGSQQINQCLFLQNNLQINHNKFGINQRNLALILDDSIQINQILITLNLFYHFCRIQKSLLMEDLVGISTTPMKPVFQITEYEYDLFRFNLQKNKEYVQDLQTQNYYEFRRFKEVLNFFFSPEEFSYYFQRESISFDEYVFIDYVIESRFQINSNRNIYLYPILHYANQKTPLSNNKYDLVQQKSSRKQIFLNGFTKQNQDEEFLINYGYHHINDYVFMAGFVPQIQSLECHQVKLLDQETEALYKQYGAEESACLDADTIPLYNFIFLNQTNPQLITLCIENYEQNLKHEVDLEFFYFNLQSYCYQNGITPPNIWNPILRIIKDFEIQISNHIKELQFYLELRIQNSKSTKIAQLLLDFQNYYLSLIKEAQQNVQNFLKNMNL